MPELKIYLFGTPRILLDDAVLSTDRRKAIALLAYLVVSRQAHSREELAALFWPEQPASKAFAYLRRTIWELNSILGLTWLEAGREQVSWKNWEHTWLDVHEFQALFSRCPPGDDSAATLAMLEEAVRLCRGNFLAGFTLQDAPAFDEWQLFTTESLRHQQVKVLERLSRGYSRAANHSLAIEYARQWILLDSLDEEAHRWLMSLFAAANQRTAALRQYEIVRQALEQQLGVQPQTETTALYNQIKSGTAPGLSPGSLNRTESQVQPMSPEVLNTLLRSSQSISSEPIARDIPASLPVPPTPFIGRVQEMDEITQLLDRQDCRLLTLLGPGGMGKTRLAIQAASRQVDRYPDGVHFISLAALADSENILPAIAKGLRFSFDENAGPVRDQLLDYLRVKKLLLILDNFEHLLTENGVRLPLEILESAGNVKILVTSRARLNVHGEFIYTVGGMNTPVSADGRETIVSLETYSAIRFFLDCARRVNAQFRLAEDNRSAVVHICQMLQGMPLGIELAAAWVEMLEPDQILAEMQNSLDFLESDQRDVPERQRSIRAVFDTTWNLLSPPEREAFQNLAIFQSGFTRQAAEEVSHAPLRILTGLLNKSLMQRVESDRFSIHELLRQYALERLQADATAWRQTQERHSKYYLDFLAAQGQDLTTIRQKAAIDSIDQEFENILQAWYWALSAHQLDRLESALTCLGFYLAVWNQAEMEAVSVRSLEYIESWADGSFEDRVALSKLLTLHAVSSFDYLAAGPTQSFTRAHQLVKENPELEEKMGLWYSVLGNIAMIRLDPVVAIEMLLRNLQRLRDSGKPWEVALTLRYLAWGYFRTRDLDRSRQAALEATDIDMANGDEASLADDLAVLSSLAQSEHSYDVAFKLIQRQREIMETLVNESYVSWTVQQLGDVCLAAGDYARAIEYFQQAGQHFERRGIRQAVAGSLSWESISALRLGEIDHARQTRLRSLKLSEELDYQTGLIWSYAEMGEIERVDQNYHLAKRWYQQALSYLDTIRVNNLRAFACRGLGQIALAQGELEQARSLFTESLESAKEDYFTWGIAYALSCLGRTAIATADLPSAWRAFEEAAGILSQWSDQGITLEMTSGIADLYLEEGHAVQAATLASFLISYKGTWHETKERASDLFIRCASRLPAAELSRTQLAGQRIALDQILEKFRSGEIQHLVD